MASLSKLGLNSIKNVRMTVFKMIARSAGPLKTYTSTSSISDLKRVKSLAVDHLFPGRRPNHCVKSFQDSAFGCTHDPERDEQSFFWKPLANKCNVANVSWFATAPSFLTLSHT